MMRIERGRGASTIQGEASASEGADRMGGPQMHRGEKPDQQAPVAGQPIGSQSEVSRRDHRTSAASIWAAQLSAGGGNPLLAPFDGPFGVPPWRAIRAEHFEPAFDVAMSAHKEQIDAIVNHPESADFDNTIAALDRAGAQLSLVTSVFAHLASADTSPAIQAIDRTVAPRLSAHADDISLNIELFARVRTVYGARASLNLTVEQGRLLEQTYNGFVRSGAALTGEPKQKLRALNERLAVLSTLFSENLLKATKSFVLFVEDAADLAGLPEDLRKAAAQEAGSRGREGAWAFTLDEPSRLPLLQFAQNRELRRKVYEGYINKASSGDSDNLPIVAEMAAVRARRAELLGFVSHAHYTLDDTMAKTLQAVTGLLDQVWGRAKARAAEEVVKMQAIIDAEGGGFQLQPSDWWFYSEKLRAKEYDFDAASLKPYLELSNMRDAAFSVASKLYGLTFEPNNDVPVWHESVQAYEVKDADGEHVGLLMLDYSTRDSKQGGAWMDALRKQCVRDGENVAPIIFNVCNFPKPTGDDPVLLSFEDVTTLFHEFGHALHGLMSKCTYEGLSGTSVADDFAELPSQIMENWAYEPEVLAPYARHWQTGEPMPTELLDKVKATKKFNQGFVTTEYLAASLLDLRWHSLTAADAKDPIDATAFEAEVMEDIGMPAQIAARYRTAYFGHIWGGGYGSGYYGYMWAEVLDADAFEAFDEAGLFDAQTAARFRRILESGGTVDPMELFRSFRGRDPSIDALLKRRGLDN